MAEQEYEATYIGDTGRKLPQDTKLRKAMNRSRLKLQAFRENQGRLIRQYVGAHYSDNGAEDKVPVNFLELAMTVYERHLSARRPKVLISPVRKEAMPPADGPTLKSTAYLLELDVNHVLREIKMLEVLRRAVKSALLSCSVLVLGKEPWGESAVEAEGVDSPPLFVDNVELDDFVCDMNARRWDTTAYIGHQFDMTVEEILRDPAFDVDEKTVRGWIREAARNEPGAGGDERASAITQGKGHLDMMYEDLVPLWHVWIRRENRVKIMPVLSEAGEVLHEYDWEGPDNGPYYMLGFHSVPGNILPLAPMSLLSDMHDLANRLFRKLGRQADREKTVTGVQGGADEDGNRIVNASDGDTIRLDNPQAINQFNTGGINQHSLLFLLQLKDLYSYMGGNIDALGGMGPQADTLGQEHLIHAQTGKRLEGMADNVVELMQDLCHDIAWYEWTDPLLERELEVKMPGPEEVVVPYTFTPDDKTGELSDFEFEVDPYSMQYRAPGERLMELFQIIGQMGPLLPIMEAQGVAFDMHGLMRTISRLADLPELADILTYETHAEKAGVSSKNHERRMPAQTTRRYERVNRPGATRQGRDETMAQLLRGGRRQPAEEAQMMRPVG